MLLSNGLHHSENLPVKFGFSPKIVPANIVQKLPSQRCSKPLFIAFFNFSHKRPTFAFTGESGYTLGSRRKIAHSGTHGETGAFRTGPLSLPSDTYCTFTNIPGPGARTAYFAALGSCPGGALEERREPSGQRCAYARRCPEGVAAPLGCVIFFASAEIAVCMPCAQGLSVCARRGVVSLWKCQEMCSRETPKI